MSDDPYSAPESADVPDEQDSQTKTVLLHLGVAAVTLMVFTAIVVCIVGALVFGRLMSM
ncbi:hypothetical protein [Fuerstiella marisgermanici]|uniref:Uncharacterized protein n=1 Tax=Fuerstiella marisgermanici TaxID=1891926 RepID=A0A1P8WE30_9PLAN|nr:hypothetical protein [Fuerstiella marisgermanici]APZ92302.1 hypothetical protein Fuma_01912 [Fuerstiella marisgermanici]